MAAPTSNRIERCDAGKEVYAIYGFREGRGVRHEAVEMAQKEVLGM